MKNVRGEARRGNARVPPSPLRAIDLESSVNPSAGSRARRKPTRFRRTISWWDLSRPSTNGARPLPRHECINEREREGERGIRATSFLCSRSTRTCSTDSDRCLVLVEKIFPIPFPVIRFRNRESRDSYSGRRELVGIDRI